MYNSFSKASRSLKLVKFHSCTWHGDLVTSLLHDYLDQVVGIG